MNHNLRPHQNPYESAIPLVSTYNQHSEDTALINNIPRRFSQSSNHHKNYLRNSDNSELPLLDTTTADDSCFSTSDSLLTTPDPRGGTLSSHEDESRPFSLRNKFTNHLPSQESSLLTTVKANNNNHMPPLQFNDHFSHHLNAKPGNGSLLLSAASLPNNPGGESRKKHDQGGLFRKQSLGDIENQSEKLPDQLPRLVAKNGNCLVTPVKMKNYLLVYKYVCFWNQNWFHVCLEYSWRMILAIFAASFVSSWIFFGLIYYLIVYMSGDLQKEPEHKQCIANVHTFVGAFLFSLESQQTIGYGSRWITEMCPPAFVTLVLQMIVGLLLQTMLAGVVIAKVLRPKKRKMEMRFSRSVVIGPLDDNDQRPALQIRIADIQHRLYLAESHVRLYMARTKINNRGKKELIGFRDLNVGYDSGWDRVLLLWPIVIRHIIDEESPLYHMTPEDMSGTNFELVMTVEGIVEATGATFQARTSFLPYEIQWGRRFTPMIFLNEKTGSYEVDYNLFEITDPCEGFVPRVLAQIQDEIEKEAEDEDAPHFHNKSGFT